MLAAPMAARGADAISLFRCGFEEDWDVNFDGWPDRWNRERGPNYPRYVRIEIVSDPADKTNHCLRIGLDGGGGALSSPEIEMSAGYSYLLEGSIKTEKLKNDAAFLTLSFYDEKHALLETLSTSRLVTAPDWTKVRIGPFTPRRRNSRYAVIGLHLEPPPGGSRLEGSPGPDWKGAALFDDLSLSRLPQMLLQSNSASHVYADGVAPEFTCRVTGFPNQAPTMRFELHGLRDELLQQEDLQLIADENELGDRGPNSKANETSGFHGAITWKPKIKETGFYRVRVQIANQTSNLYERSTTLIVLPPGNRPTAGEFGWSLPDGDEPLPLVPLAELLGQAGVHYVKFPVWSAGRNQARADRLVWFTERLNFQGIQLIGLLLEPPPDAEGTNLAKPSATADANGGAAALAPETASPVAAGGETSAAETVAAESAQEGTSGAKVRPKRKAPGAAANLAVDSPLSVPLSAATVFADDPQSWYPSLEPVLTRLSLKVRMWQLGRDQDTSFVGYPDLPKKILALKHQLQRFNQELHIGFGWRYLNEVPEATPAPWSFLSLSANPPLTADELQVYLPRERKGPVKHWVVLEPLSRQEYSLEARVQDLIQRMLAAKIQNADGVFNPQPFSDDRGLMNADGTPGELFLPWRTMALALGGAEYLGTLELPERSPNQVFSRNGETIMVVWNDRPTQETLYLGENVHLMDPFGRSVQPALDGEQQIIPVGPLPTIVTGLSEPIARWRLSFAFASRQMPSVIGKPLSNPFSFQNFFPQGISGTVKLNLPEGWRTTLDRQSLKAASGEKVTLPLEVALPFDAASGHQKIRIDFDISAGRPYQFSIYHALDIGQGDVDIEVHSRLNEKGELEVEQQLTNRTDQAVSFKCQLFIPDRRRMVSQVVEQDRGRDTKVYRLQDGRELLGKTLWLRAEEIGGQRVLNYRFPAEE
ncbi:MAG TPA: hypothetical protein VFE24_04760 [Pirellulales bacterium]|nr:hypothetical protein [Pirellulales bacterium]